MPLTPRQKLRLELQRAESNVDFALDRYAEARRQADAAWAAIETARKAETEARHRLVTLMLEEGSSGT